MIGSRIGPYEITAKLGEGGMGLVYKAKDFHLGRDVALKVLPDTFAEDPERLARFEREAKLLAQLNHPNIAQIHALEKWGQLPISRPSSNAPEAAGKSETVPILALVMELVEGPTLAERLEQGPLPFNESLSISLQIAQALEEAHEKGIVHRDLKPQNVKASIEGKVKVLDFGLAKAMDPAGGAAGGGAASASQLAHSPTLTLGGTAMGVILGTAAYMAPEQAKGLPVGKRADIWAFGVVLWEMLTGTRLFGGDSVPEMLAGVLKNPIDFAALPAETPPAIRRLLRRCLERNPKDRLHDIGDARLVLEEIAAGRMDEAAAPAASPPAPQRSSRGAWLAPGLAGLALGALGLALLERTLLAPQPAEPPTLSSLTYSGRDSAPSVSPDGKTIAFTSTRDGRSRIWLKQLASGEEVALTSGPADFDPDYSPDGSSILFLRGNEPPYELFRIPALGGEPRRVARGVASGAAWSPDGKRIALTRASGGAVNADVLVTISADGDDEREVARTPEVNLFNPRWSPDGRTIGVWTNLRTNFAALQSIAELDVATGALRTIYQPGGAIFGGWDWSGAESVLVAESGTQSGRGGGRLRTVPRSGGPALTRLSLAQASPTLAVAGPGRVVVEQISPIQSLGEHTLAPGSESPPAARWLTRGASVDRQPTYSPDGRHVLFNSDRGGNLDLWELDLESGAVRRLTTDAADDWDPAYAHDGKSILWSSNRSGNFEIWIAERDGSGAKKLTADGVDAENPTMTPDGSWVVYVSANPSQKGVWKIGTDGQGAVRLVAGALTISELSPDGRWISVIDTDLVAVRVLATSDGSEIATVPISPWVRPGTQLGRSRWIAGTRTLVWLDFDEAHGSTALVAQEIAPGRDTSATRRTLFVGPPEAMPESFALAPDGSRVVISAIENRSDLLLIDGLPGVER